MECVAKGLGQFIYKLTLVHKHRRAFREGWSRGDWKLRVRPRYKNGTSVCLLNLQ